MTIITGPAWYCPQPDVHICSGGPAWSATTIPNDEYLGLASPAEGVWVATGKGQAGTTPTSTAISVDNGGNWAPGGQISNNANTTPFFLTAGNGRLVCLQGPNAVISLDRGANWVRGVSVTFSCVGLQFGGAQFVFVDGTASAVYTTVDGLTLTTLATPANFSAVFWDAYRARWLCFEAAGSRTWTTPDFVTYTLQGSLTRSGSDIGNYCVAQSDVGTIVVIFQGAATTADRSTDGGATWAATGFLGVSQNNSVIWGNGGFLAAQALGSTNARSNDDGQNWISAPFMTMTKTWVQRWDGINTYVAVGSPGSADTVANLGVC